MPTSRWITGRARSGKTTTLINTLQEWSQGQTPFSAIQESSLQGPARLGQVNLGQPNLGNRGVLVFAATGDNRMVLADAILQQTRGQVPFDSATPLGFFETEINLFWPLVAQSIGSTIPFPLRLRPETEQELATRLWQADLDQGQLQQDGVRDYYMVRRTLDLWQLAASGGIPLSDIPQILKQGIGEEDLLAARWDCMGAVLQRWSSWCVERGLLTYGLISDLYWQVLLPNPLYQRQLYRRYWAIFADDVDEYPAIARQLFTTVLNEGMPGVFTFNPDGGIRLGLGADPDAIVELAHLCDATSLSNRTTDTLAPQLGDRLWQTVIDPFSMDALIPETSPKSLQCIRTISRAELLRQIADVIATAIADGEIAAYEIAIIGPGVDAIARYALREMLGARGIAVEGLNEQRAIASSATVRALLTLMGLVYPGLGRLVDRESVAELLVVMSQRPDINAVIPGNITPRIDPVRAGLIVDHCFKPDPFHPELLPVESFSRWDRLGYQGTQTYSDIRQWVATQRQQQQERLLLNPVTLLDRAIQYFFMGGSHLPYDHLAILRELMETAQHYWDVDARLRQRGTGARLSSPLASSIPSLLSSPVANSFALNPESSQEPMTNTVGRFIQLLRNGTITADPYPTRTLGQVSDALGNPHSQGITLATLFQYRANRLNHRWQFWLDAGSSLWLTGGEPLFGAPLLLQGWSGRLWTEADDQQASQERLRRSLMELLGRTAERVYLCHSDLATGGYEQAGPLLSLVEQTIASCD